MNIKFENLEKIDEVLNLLKHIQEAQQIPKRWLNIEEASNYLGYSRDYMYTIKDDSFIEGKHFFKKGKLIFDKYELDNWVISSSDKIKPKKIVNQILQDLV